MILRQKCLAPIGYALNVYAVLARPRCLKGIIVEPVLSAASQADSELVSGFPSPLL